MVLQSVMQKLSFIARLWGRHTPMQGQESLTQECSDAVLDQDEPEEPVTPTMEVNLLRRIKAEEATAVRNSGLSEVLYESLLQKAYRKILSEAEEEDRDRTEAILLERGYEPDFKPYVAGPGECPHTGIDANCCPCAWHE